MLTQLAWKLGEGFEHRREPLFVVGGLREACGRHQHVLGVDRSPSVVALREAPAGATRSKLLPDLPTIAETLPGYSASGWYGLLAPAATPQPIIARLHVEAAKALHSPDIVAKLASQGAEPVGNTPEEFTAFVRSEISKWANLVQATKMRTD